MYALGGTLDSGGESPPYHLVAHVISQGQVGVVTPASTASWTGCVCSAVALERPCGLPHV
eukprot:6109713-Alexandrium_andersonii.AAC.1